MPRGTHRGIWKPLPKDIFKSRWKAFYKRCFRPRSVGNTVDRRPPHIQATFTEDVPSPWKFHLYPKQAPEQTSPLDSTAFRAYRSTIGNYLRPAYAASEGTASDVVLRCLDAGRRGSGSLSGLGRLEAAWGMQMGGSGRDSLAPQHIHGVLKKLCGQNPDEVIAKQTRFFQVRRLMHLLEEQDDTQGICDCVELITGASPEALLQCCTGNRLVKWQAFANEASRQ
ncbi:unnamed protein product, partial [Symbiodinium necroappetens]